MAVQSEEEEEKGDIITPKDNLNCDQNEVYKPLLCTQTSVPKVQFAEDNLNSATTLQDVPLNTVLLRRENP